MIQARFEALAEAFGGDTSRWPAAEREAAAALMATDPAWTGRLLAEASKLDAQLEAYVAPPVPPGLVDRIVSSAPSGRSAPWRAWLAPLGLGAGLAAACAAGVIAGAQLSIRALPSDGPAARADPLVTAVGDDDFSLYIDEAA